MSTKYEKKKKKSARSLNLHFFFFLNLHTIFLKIFNTEFCERMQKRRFVSVADDCIVLEATDDILFHHRNSLLVSSAFAHHV